MPTVEYFGASEVKSLRSSILGEGVWPPRTRLSAGIVPDITDQVVVAIESSEPFEQFDRNEDLSPLHKSTRTAQVVAAKASMELTIEISLSHLRVSTTLNEGKNPGQSGGDGEPAYRRETAKCDSGVTPSAVERRDLHVRDPAFCHPREPRAILSHD